MHSSENIAISTWQDSRAKNHLKNCCKSLPSTSEGHFVTRNAYHFAIVFVHKVGHNSRNVTWTKEIWKGDLLSSSLLHESMKTQDAHPEGLNNGETIQSTQIQLDTTQQYVIGYKTICKNQKLKNLAGIIFHVSRCVSWAWFIPRNWGSRWSRCF